MKIMQQNKVGLESDKITSNNNDLSSGIYLADAKLVQCRLVAENRR